jgi:DNA-binding NarL/FixJ family response regulator
MIRVLLIDDHPVVRAGYRRLLEQTGDIVVSDEAQDAEQGYRLFCDTQPDVCISDLSLPGIGGLELLRKVRARDPRARVLIFSMYDAPQLIQRAVDGGASGFVSKQAAPDELVDAVRVVHAGGRYFGPGAAPPRPGPADENERLNSLSQREFEIFRLLAAGRSPAECALILNLSSKTVANNQSSIREKLDVATSAALAHLALRNGIIATSGP